MAPFKTKKGHDSLYGNLFDLEQFEYVLIKLNYGAFLPLKFCHWTLGFNQKRDIMKNVDVYGSSEKCL